MSFWEVFGLVFGSFRTNKLRTFLTLLGVIIGVTTVITVVSIVKGMDRYVLSTLTRTGSNTFRVVRFGIIRSEEEFRRALRRRDLTVEDMRAVQERCHLCEEVGAVSIIPSFVIENVFVAVSAGRQSIEDPTILGVTSNFGDIANREVESGRYLTESEVDHTAFSAVIGFEIAKNLFPNIDPLGKILNINGHHFRVVGVSKKYGSFFGQNQDTYIEVPISSFQKLFGKRAPVALMVKVQDVTAMNEAQDQVRVVLRGRQHTHTGDVDGFDMLTTGELVDLWKAFSAGAFAAMIGIASIALVVGGIVIMNIMLVSVVERTSEIGLRKAMGARKRDIRRQFLMESVILAVAGGMIGVALGAMAAKVISAVSPMPSSLEPGPVIAGLFLACSVGLVSGVWPAMKASRLDPIVALRQE
jgi:putative ABC transport system permease protein